MDNNPDAASGLVIRCSSVTNLITSGTCSITHDNNLVKLTISERIWNDAQIVNHVCLSPRIGIDTGSAWKLVLAAANVKNSFGSFRLEALEKRSLVAAVLRLFTVP